MMTPVLYACDPEKNASCPKTACKYNTKARFQDCYSTSHIEFARQDARGTPIVDDVLTAFARSFSPNEYGDNHTYHTTP